MTLSQVPAHANNYAPGRASQQVKFVIVHWIVGNLASADKTFQNPTRLASAHYGIEDDQIHQYVDESDTAWHASNLTINRQSIGIEHSGGEILSNGQRRVPSDKTHETSGLLIRDICKKYNIPIDKDHILPHMKFSPTQCPGTLNIDKLIKYAQGSIPMPDTIPVNKLVWEKVRGNSESYDELCAKLGVARDSKKEVAFAALEQRMSEEFNKGVEEGKKLAPPSTNLPDEIDLSNYKLIAKLRV